MVQLLDANKQRIAEICKRHFVKCLYVFESSVRGSFTDNSVIDFSCEIDVDGFPGRAAGAYGYADTLLRLKKFMNQLQKRPIGLIPSSEIQNMYFKESVERSKLMIYAA